MGDIRQKSLPFNSTIVGSGAEGQHIRTLPLSVRVLVSRYKLSTWHAATIAEIVGLGGSAND